MYTIKFSNVTLTVDEKGLRNFIEVAVINNKDIHNFTVTRIK